MKIIIFISISCIVFFACETKPSNLNLEDIRFNLLDSIVIEEGYLNFADKSDSKLLFYNKASFSIYTFDINDSTLRQFNHYGTAPEEYRIIYNNLGIFQDSIIMVGQINKILFYRPNGDYLKTLSLMDHDTRAPLMRPKSIDDKFFFINSPQGNFSHKSFYDKQHKVLMSYDLFTNDILEFADFPVSNSRYVNEKYYYLYSGIFFLETDNNFIYLISKNEDILQKYNLDGKLVKNFNIPLSQFNPYPVSFSESLTDQEMDFVMYQNSTIQNLSVSKDQIYLAYTKAYTKDELDDYVEDHPDFHGFDRPNLKYVLGIYDKNGKSVYKNTRVPEKFGKFLFAKDDILYFQKENFEEQDLVTVLYKISIDAQI